MKTFCVKLSYVVLLLTLFRLGSSAMGTTTFQWPEIRPVQKGYKFLAANRADVTIPILGVDGKTLYRFRCTPDLPSDGTIGALACYLITAESEDDGIDSRTLLTDDPMDDVVAHSRGQIWAYDLSQDCADYPEYGTDRTFRLRGMRVTLRVREVQFASTRKPHNPTQSVNWIHAFRFAVTVAPDRDAVSAVAEPVRYAPPSLSDGTDPWNTAPNCGAVIATHVPGDLTDVFVERQGLSGPFPEVARTEKTVVLDASKMQGYDFAFPAYPMPPKARMYSFPVLSSEGKHVYDFSCSGYATGGRFERYGIVCGLFLPEKDFNLLADGVDPYSRMSPSEILPDQLYGACGDYPGWGRRREFRLRGMRVTMTLSNPEFAPSDFEDRALVSAQLRVQIEPDPSATSLVAAPPTTIYWGVRHGPEPCDVALVAPSQASH